MSLDLFLPHVHLFSFLFRTVTRVFLFYATQMAQEKTNGLARTL